MDVLPEWPEGTVAVLATGERHQIPISLVQRAGDREIVIGLAPTRESLANLRDEPRCSLTILGPGLAFTAYGSGRVIDDEPIVAVRIEVGEIIDHDKDTFEITSGVAFAWRDDDAAERDAAAREALRRLA